MYIYLDLVFLLNSIIDFLLILGTNRLTGFPLAPGKGILGAVVGGVYGMLCLIPDLWFLGSFLWRLVFFGLMSSLAFGFNRSALSRGAILLLLSMALGGIATGAGVRDFFAVCLCGVFVTVLCKLGVGGLSNGRTYVPVELNWQGRQIKLMALQDTGNTLRDPMTGEQILICGADVGAELFGLTENCFSDPVSLLSSGELPGLRLVPYHTVGQAGGMMIVLRIKSAKINGVSMDPLVGFASQRIGSGEGYRMLTGGMI